MKSMTILLILSFLIISGNVQAGIAPDDVVTADRLDDLAKIYKKQAMKKYAIKIKVGKDREGTVWYRITGKIPKKCKDYLEFDEPSSGEHYKHNQYLDIKAPKGFKKLRKCIESNLDEELIDVSEVSGGEYARRKVKRGHSMLFISRYDDDDDGMKTGHASASVKKTVGSKGSTAECTECNDVINKRGALDPNNEKHMKTLLAALLKKYYGSSVNVKTLEKKKKAKDMMKKAIKLYKERKITEFLKLAKKMKELDPENPDYRVLLAKGYAASGNQLVKALYGMLQNPQTRNSQQRVQLATYAKSYMKQAGEEYSAYLRMQGKLSGTKSMSSKEKEFAKSMLTIEMARMKLSGDPKYSHSVYAVFGQSNRASMPGMAPQQSGFYQMYNRQMMYNPAMMMYQRNMIYSPTGPRMYGMPTMVPYR